MLWPARGQEGPGKQARRAVLDGMAVCLIPDCGGWDCEKSVNLENRLEVTSLRWKGRWDTGEERAW